MSGLQESFYIIGIVFMSIMMLLVIALVIAVFVIRSKINKIHSMIDHKISTVTQIAGKGGELAGIAAAGVVRKAKKAINKK